MAEYADIIVDISLGKLDRTFQYRIPEELAAQIGPGVLVEVPFGNGGRRIQGYVIEVTDRPEIDEARIKDIISVVQKSIPIESQLIALGRMDAGKLRRDDESGAEDCASCESEDCRKAAAADSSDSGNGGGRTAFEAAGKKASDCQGETSWRSDRAVASAL